MKTLYISDIDRTIRPHTGVTPGSRRMLDRLAAAGILTSAATGRSLQSALYALDGLRFTAPISVMTGAVIYDGNAGKELVRHTITPEALREIIALSASAGADLFVYTLTGADAEPPNSIRVYHKKLKSPHASAFRDMRASVAMQEFIELEDFTARTETPPDIVYAVAVGQEQLLSGIEVPGVKCEKYLEHATGCCYAEFFSIYGGKDTSAAEIKRLTGADRMVGFGDNYNDIALARVCDEFYAVENAVEELLEYADGTVPPAEEDGALRYVCEREGISLG